MLRQGERPAFGKLPRCSPQHRDRMHSLSRLWNLQFFQRGCSLLSSTLHPHLLFLGMLSGWLGRLTFARANISSKGVC